MEAEKKRKCADCNGTGTNMDTQCGACAGKGYLGNCYASSGRLLLKCHARGDTELIGNHFFEIRLEDLTLVHGYPTLTHEPFERYGHAWLEIGHSFVYDTESDILLPSSMYYKFGKIDHRECIRYSHAELSEQIKGAGHWGPWGNEEQYPLASGKVGSS